ncbi:hypothetical protein [Streptomyces nigrescens]|uniref:FtsK domain-containing protein n=1 Tax=Streptomyces nigrescens TaxID=1920 RepID=A0A640TCN3_STRNI|nr:hypothetical protein [Streptomyces libani]WAT94907.1 hypothetical protein STRLI_000579 [Streptomyces libani subsp. libani]GFE20056.1 hypothetical protein Sliba_05090 [Streptomyces libani subsp. libani]GGV85696.1 hypothetical protein GCM10010500_02620 [Streptomyces libani subsp. libani]
MAIHTPPADTQNDIDVPEFMRAETASDRPNLSLVKPSPEPLEGPVVKHQGETLRPTWIDSGKELATRAREHAAENRLYVGWSVRGYRNLGRRWLEARRDGHPQMIQSAKAEREAVASDTAAEAAAHELVQERRAQYRLHKRWHWIKTGGWSAAGAAGVTVGAVTGGIWVDLAMATAAYVSGIYHGRPDPAVAEVAVPPLSVIGQSDSGFGQVGGQVFMTVDQLREGAKPFVIAQARTPMQLAECVLLALVAEGVPVAEVTDVIRLSWGWQCIVRVSEGTPEAIIKVAGGLETRFDLAANGVRPTPLKERRACAVLRLVDRGADPFASAPGLPYRAPKSMSITDKFRIGSSVGGDELAASLAGVMGLWVAASGGGKTGILQALAEGTTACYDNITIDLDPHGDGLEDLHDAVRITARTNEQIEAVLLFFLVMSKARARLRKTLGMGRKWKASKTHPAVTIFFDEFPKATELAKRLTFDLLLVGRKELIEVEIASQGGQKGYLGENFAQMLALKAVGPCKVGDTRAVFGDGAVNEGWLPHRLAPATDTDPKDAGHIYIQGVPGMPDEPIEYKVHEVPSATLRKLAAERLEAGLVEPDQDSLDAMADVDLPEYVEAVYDIEGNLKKEAPVDLLTWDALLRLCGAEPGGYVKQMTPEQKLQLDAALGALNAMDRLGRDVAQLDEMAEIIGDGMTADRLGELLRAVGAGGTVKIAVPHRSGRVNGYQRAEIADAVSLFDAA